MYPPFDQIMIREVFQCLDDTDRPLIKSSLEIALVDGGYMTITTPGGGLRLPSRVFGVLSDHPMSRIWNRYAVNRLRTEFVGVPRVLVTHHIHTHGGIDHVVDPGGSKVVI